MMRRYDDGGDCADGGFSGYGDGPRHGDDSGYGGGGRGSGHRAVVDVGIADVRAYGPAGVIREPAAVGLVDGRLRFGAAADEAPPGAYEPRLPEAIDEPFMGLGEYVFRTRDLLRGLLRHALAGVRPVGSGREAVTVAVPGAWGGVRRGTLERAAVGITDRMRIVGSARCAEAAARAEGLLHGDAAAVVVEQWPDAAIAVVVDRSAGANACAAVRPGVVVGRGGGYRGGAVDRDRLDGIIAAAASGGGSGPGLIVPRGGWEFPRELQASAPERLVFADGDIVLRGARLTG